MLAWRAILTAPRLARGGAVRFARPRRTHVVGPTHAPDARRRRSRRGPPRARKLRLRHAPSQGWYITPSEPLRAAGTLPAPMGELGAFLKIHRVGFDKRDPRERVRDYDQYFALQSETELRQQGARCMDCGIPFCHEGCPWAT